MFFVSKCQAAEFFHHLAVIVMCKKGGAGDEHVGAASAQGPIVWSLMPPSTDSSKSFPPTARRRRKRSTACGSNSCPPNPAGDAHHQHEVAVVEIGLNGLDRRGRIKRQTGNCPKAADFPQQRTRIVDRFDVDRHQVGPRLAESLQVAARFGNHQVKIQRQAGRTANGLDHGKTETDVGHEMPIHDIQMQDLGPGLFQAANFLSR